MHTSDALSRLQSIADTPNNKDVIPLNFDIIMNDTFIHSTAEEHMDDLLDLLKVL